jgi:hypothetical protein
MNLFPIVMFRQKSKLPHQDHFQAATEKKKRTWLGVGNMQNVATMVYYSLYIHSMAEKVISLINPSNRVSSLFRAFLAFLF